MGLVYSAPGMNTFTGFDAWLRLHDCCEATIEDRRYVLAHFARDVPSFPHCTPNQVTAWLGRPGFAQWTRSTYFGHLRSYYAWAAQAGVITVDPMAGMRWPRRRRSAPRPLTPAQVRVVLGGANPKMRAWLTLGLLAGLRASEIAKLSGEDVEQDKLWVLGKGGKGAFVPTHPRIWALAALRGSSSWLRCP